MKILHVNRGDRSVERRREEEEEGEGGGGGVICTSRGVMTRESYIRGEFVCIKVGDRCCRHSKADRKSLTFQRKSDCSGAAIKRYL